MLCSDFKIFLIYYQRLCLNLQQNDDFEILSLDAQVKNKEASWLYAELLQIMCSEDVVKKKWVIRYILHIFISLLCLVMQF